MYVYIYIDHAFSKTITSFPMLFTVKNNEPFLILSIINEHCIHELIKFYKVLLQLLIKRAAVTRHLVFGKLL